MTVSSGGSSSNTTAAAAPQGAITLFEISQIPNTILYGEAPTGTVTNGDVFVQVIAQNGVLTVDPAQLGDPALLSQGINNAAEVFGMTYTGVPQAAFNGNVSVCLQGSGDFYFRDSTGQPRVTVQMNTTSSGGYTCAVIPNSGTILLTLTGTQLPTTGGNRKLLPPNCMVTTLAILNLREGPGTNYDILRPIPYDVTLSAFHREGIWFEVDYLGLRGWLSGQYLPVE